MLPEYRPVVNLAKNHGRLASPIYAPTRPAGAMLATYSKNLDDHTASPKENNMMYRMRLPRCGPGLRIKEAGNNVGIRLKDHIIIGDNKYVSLKDRGLF